MLLPLLMHHIADWSLSQIVRPPLDARGRERYAERSCVESWYDNQDREDEVRKLRVAIIGQGRSGYSIHGDHIRALPRMFQVVAATDPLKERRDRAAREFGCDVYRDHKPLLKRKDIDFVVNASPSQYHLPYTLELFRAGHNVLCEKPLAKTVKDVDRMIAAAKKAGKMFAVYQQSRFAPYFRKLKQVIESGVLGRIVQISIAFSGFARRWDWQTLTAWHGGNLMNTGPHPLDQALRFMDLPLDTVPEVFCRMDRGHFWGDAEAHVNLTMHAQGAPIIDLEISSCNAYPSFLYNVYGTRGGMKASTTEAEWRYYKPSEAPRRRVTTKPIRNPDGTPAYCTERLKWHTGKWKVPPSQRDLFHTLGCAFYRMLYKHIVKGAPLEVTPLQVRQQIAVIEECHRQNPHIWGKTRKKSTPNT